MRALLTSDLQLRNFNQFSSITEGGYNSRLLALLDGLTAILQREQPEILIIAGDLFHGTYSGSTGSSHRGGHYSNIHTGDHYRDRQGGTPY
jgi:metallophosphoesterase superfamily enzyme